MTFSARRASQRTFLRVPLSRASGCPPAAGERSCQMASSMSRTTRFPWAARRSSRRLGIRSTCRCTSETSQSARASSSRARRERAARRVRARVAAPPEWNRRSSSSLSSGAWRIAMPYRPSSALGIRVRTRNEGEVGPMAPRAPTSVVHARATSRYSRSYRGTPTALRESCSRATARHRARQSGSFASARIATAAAS